MKPEPPRCYRQSLLLAGLIPLGVTIVTALVQVAFSADQAGLVATLIVGSVSTLGVVTVLSLLTRRLAALAAACEGASAGGAPVDALARRADEIGSISRALVASSKREEALRANAEQALQDAAANVAKLADGFGFTEIRADGLGAEAVQQLNTAMQEAGKKLAVVRQRLASVVRIVQELPSPVLAVDSTGALRYLNAAAERLLGQPFARCARKPLSSFIAQPTAERDPFGRAMLDPATISTWLQRGGASEVVVDLLRTDGPVRVALRGKLLTGSVDRTCYLIARELTEELRLLGQDRARTREATLQGVWDSLERAGVDAVDAILACSRLLASDAKQSSGRSAMLPRVNSIRQHAGALEAYLRVTRWLNRSLASQWPQPMETEFLAVEPVRAAIDQLALPLKSRNITINLNDQGGWIYADEEWLKTIVLGVLLHAIATTVNSTLGIQLQRISPQDGRGGERLSLKFVDAGSALNPAQLEELTHPFGGLESPSFLNPSGTGFLPGLILAREMTERMGGTIDFHSSGGGNLIIQIGLATRISSSVGATVPSDAADLTPVEELVIGWKLGAA